MSVVASNRSVPIQKRGLDHQGVGVADMLLQSLGGFGVTHDDQFLASLRRSEDVFGVYGFAARKLHRPSFRQLLAQRPVGHVERSEAIRSKMTARPAFKGESKTVGVAMSYRKAADCEFAGVEHLARQRNELQRYRRTPLAPQAGQHPDDNIKGAGACVNRHRLRALPQAKRGKQTGKAEHVIEMTMGQQDPVEPPEAGAATQ